MTDKGFGRLLWEALGAPALLYLWIAFELFVSLRWPIVAVTVIVLMIRLGRKLDRIHERLNGEN